MQISSIFFHVLFTVSILFYSTIRTSHARDTITKATPLNVSYETIISAANIFELGFISLPDSDGSNIYVGIWYYRSQPRTIVWLANIGQPFSPDSKRVVSIGKDGNLEAMDTKISTTSSSSNTTAKLLDSGNLVLIDNQSSKYLWQSFEHPTDTFLPGMLMTANLELTSGGDKDTSEEGVYKFKLEEESQYVIMKNDDLYWKSGDPNDKLSNSEMLPLVASLLKNSGSITTKLGNKTLSYNKTSPLERLVLNSSGVLQYYQNVNDMIWFAPQQQCSLYNACGDYGICKQIDEQEKECNCLKGFDQLRDYTRGCIRKTDLCNGTQGRDTFLSMPSVKLVPGRLHIGSDNENSCSDYCLGDCECQAYSFIGGGEDNYRNRLINKSKTECWVWRRDLKDLREGMPDGINLQIRIAVSDLASANQPNSTTSNEPRQQNSSQIKHRVLIISTTVIAATIVICILSYLFYRRNIAKNRIARTSTPNSGSLQPMVFITESHASDTTHGNNRKSIDVSFFKFQTILVATDNFSEANKLGEGGFGPVYRGVFAGEQYLAVKRLSSSSGQGVEEFQNEVALIAKLQHRNLVRVLGYCLEKNERVLLYEYMPNKSLDKFIFNQKLSYLLDWRKRFDIIFGVARGLLYLHEDSRLRIIHRDLKTSNILLDEEMNPKISDFGLARIVQGKETEGNTNRVVGSYGYMSPEYALEGLFSIKSDVFSFGVIILEIISGKRNTGFYQSTEALNLLGYAWKLWEAKKHLDLLDEALEGRCNQTEVAKCVNIGLLCVQEDPGDRPTMANVAAMLSSESIAIPTPSQPAFIERRSLPSTSSSSSTYREAPSFNKLTVTMQEGR